MNPQVPPADIRAERRKILRAASVSLPLCAGVLAAAWWFLPAWFVFPEALIDRLVFAIRADVFVLLWVLLGVGIVSRARRHSAADIHAALSGPPSPRIAVHIAFLQNTLEQAVLAIGAHLALATLVTGPALALIPGSVVLFAIGRATFLWGYRQGAGGRAFGMVTTALPTFAAYGWLVWLILAQAAK